METKELTRKLAIKGNELDIANRSINMLKEEIAHLNATVKHSHPSSPKNNSMKRPGTSSQPQNNNLVTSEQPPTLIIEEEKDPWVIHNALSKPSSPISTGSKKIIVNSYSAPNLQPRKAGEDDSGVLDLNSINYNNKHRNTIANGNGQFPQVVGGTLLAATVEKGLLPKRKLSTHPQQSAAEWQVEKLSKEVSNLAMQLGESLREKEQQRLEISRLRKQSMSL